MQRKEGTFLVLLIISTSRFLACWPLFQLIILQLFLPLLGERFYMRELTHKKFEFIFLIYIQANKDFYRYKFLYHMTFGNICSVVYIHLSPKMQYNRRKKFPVLSQHSRFSNKLELPATISVQYSETKMPKTSKLQSKDTDHKFK